MKEYKSPPSLDDVLDTVLPYNHPLKTQDMKDTEFKTGEYCRFPNSEIPEMLDLLRENGYKVHEHMKDIIGAEIILFDGGFFPSYNAVATCDREHIEISPSEFLHKATRGKFKPEDVFDSSLPFELSYNGVDWFRLEAAGFDHYVGVNIDGEHVIQTPGGYESVKHIRNVQAFDASMLEVGEYMVVESGCNDYENKTLLACHSNVVICIEDGYLFEPAHALNWIKGRRVKVNITTEEY